MGRVLLVAGALWVASSAAHAATEVSSTTPYPGVTHSVWEDADLSARVHVLTLDLSSSELVMLATEESERGQTPSAYALAKGAQIAVNGDFFSAQDFQPQGLAMGEGIVWANAADSDQQGFLRFDRNGARTHMIISPPEDVVDIDSLGTTGTIGIVGGRPMLVRSGVAETTFDCGDLVALPCSPAPRTAVAVSQDGNTGWLIVVDGWQASSAGMTAGQLGAFLDVELGVYNALMLDIGSASSMFIESEGGVVSSPSDGVERLVSNHLAVVHGALTAGSMRGVVRERDIMGAELPGTVITLDDDQTATYDGVLWTFSVAPRYVCATATLAGYRELTQCRQVPPGGEVFNSFFLFPDSDFVDAAPGAPDASRLDGGNIGGDSGNAGSDGGMDPPGGGGCGCRTPGSRDMPGALAMAFVLLLAWRRAR